MSSALSEPHESPDTMASNTENPSLIIGQHALFNNTCGSIMAGKLQRGPCESAPGGRACSWGNYTSLTQPTHRRLALSTFDPHLRV